MAKLVISHPVVVRHAPSVWSGAGIGIDSAMCMSDICPTSFVNHHVPISYNGSMDDNPDNRPDNHSNNSNSALHYPVNTIQNIFLKRNPIVRMGLLMALFAWFMQASVFLMPLFGNQASSQTVCDRITQTLPLQKDVTAFATAAHLTATDHHTLDTTSKQAHHSHTDCHFCVIAGFLSGSYNPFTVIALPRAAVFYQTKASVLRTFNLTYNRALRPPSQAPPFII